MEPRRFLLLDAKNEPHWVRLYVRPIGEQWVALLVPDAVEPPRTGRLEGLGFFGDTPAEVTALALGFVGRCTEQN
jgi:hypothetical protein